MQTNTHTTTTCIFCQLDFGHSKHCSRCMYPLLLM